MQWSENIENKHDSKRFTEENVASRRPEKFRPLSKNLNFVLIQILKAAVEYRTNSQSLDLKERHDVFYQEQREFLKKQIRFDETTWSIFAKIDRMKISKQRAITQLRLQILHETLSK